MDRREELFWKKVNKNAPNGCWEYNNERCGKMHAPVTFKGVHTHAHRISWELHHGKIPKGKFILHNCDNGICVNPAHLRIGTQKENMHDMFSRGRGYKFPVRKGEQHGMAKISEEDVREIRKSYASGDVSQWDLARKYKIGQTQIGRIIKKEVWKDVA